MDWVGIRIVDRDMHEIGIVVSEVKGLHSFYRVRFWNEQRKEYVTKTMSCKWFDLYYAGELALTNDSDPVYCASLAEAVMELSLQTRDRGWFDSVKNIGQKQK